jgi:DNA repair exonuclease SbcCD ATPase subunit
MSNVFDDLKQRALEINKKQELLKDYIAQLESAQAIDAEIKELQEKRKAVIAADTEIFALTNEIKELSKEFGKAAKTVSKGFSFKPAVTKAYVKAAIKSDEAVVAVKVKGAAFSFLEGKFSEKS